MCRLCILPDTGTQGALARRFFCMSFTLEGLRIHLQLKAISFSMFSHADSLFERIVELGGWKDKRTRGSGRCPGDGAWDGPCMAPLGPLNVSYTRPTTTERRRRIQEINYGKRN